MKKFVLLLVLLLLVLLLLVLLLLVLLRTGAIRAEAPPPSPGPIILISIDGFRADYLSRGHTPVLKELAQTGVRATAMHPSFPSLTYPNHYTLVTGLRPDHHGVVDNVMMDPTVSPDKFTMDAKSAEDPRWWEGGTPIWVTAQAAGQIVASAGWAGSEGLIDKHRPNYLDPWRDHREPDEIAAVTLNWLDLPLSLRPSLILLYFDDVDHAGHDFGPDSPQLNEALHKVDDALGTLVAGLKRRHLYDGAEIIIVSDHGMAATANARNSLVDDLVDMDHVDVRTIGATLGLDAKPGFEAEVAAALLKPHAHFSCWRKGEIPAALHYGSNPRIPQFICQNEEGWRFAARKEAAGWTKEHPGGHGYDPRLPVMDALFVAHGPAFRPGTVLAPFDNVDVYPLLAHLTGLKPEPNDGDLAPLAPALK